MGLIEHIRNREQKANEYDRLADEVKADEVVRARQEVLDAKEGLAYMVSQQKDTQRGLANLLGGVDSATFTGLATNPITHKLVGSDTVTTIANGRAINEILKRINQ